jgi:long-chain acyl-CoA synthetase
VVIKILDEDGQERPSGEQGLLYMTATLWEFEYHHDANKTESATSEGMFTVGDIGYLDKDGSALTPTVWPTQPQPRINSQPL